MLNQTPGEYSNDEVFDLATENEIMAMRLEAEMGATIYRTGSLPPEIESLFLEHVYAFEKACQNVRMAPVHELIGSPPYLSAESLNDEEVSIELSRILSLFYAHSMTIDIPANKQPRAVYKFITEYLFDELVEDIKMPGLRRHFIYNAEMEERLGE